jgi:DHA1 family multidrug resistance protein-like MFS transporter
MFAFGIFNIAVAVAKDIQTIMICRFFAGLFGSCPLTVVAAVYSDMYSNAYRGLAVASFSATVICGPLLAPFIGGFIASGYLTWRWNEYLPAILAFSGCILSFIFQKESYGPVILVSKASDLRRRTKNWGIHAKQEEVEVDFQELVSKNISRPLRILFTEPIVLFVTIYMSFLYGILYLSLTAYSIVFGQIHGFAPGVDGLPYFGMIIGCLIGYASVCIDVPRYAKKLKANNDVPVPEWRMPLPMVGGILFSAGTYRLMCEHLTEPN